MVIHHSALNSLNSMEFFTHAVRTCTVAWRLSPYVSHRLWTHPGNSRSALYTRGTPRNDPHGNAPLSGEHSAANGTFVHLLCGAVKLHGSRPCTSPTGCVRILGSPVAPCTRVVRLRTTLIIMLHMVVNTAVNEIFVHPLYGHVQLDGGGPCTYPTGSVQILESPVAHCTLGAHLGTTLIVMHYSAVNTVPSK